MHLTKIAPDANQFRFYRMEIVPGLFGDWGLRAKQIDLVIASTVGMHGELQGIAGRSMPEIESVEALLIGKDDQE